MALIIVESPTKARTFNRLLKKQDHFVFATMGHIRDLPPNKIALDLENNFQPNYVIIHNKEKIVAQLKQLAAKNQEIILATDPDREGESIAYHIAYVLGLIKEKWPDFTYKKTAKTLKRIVFHEITSNALKAALNKPEELRFNLVKAQQARRILDRIVGYLISPLLWKKIGKNWLSAGRVQTVALRLIVEREKEINSFNSENYFQIYGLFNNHATTKAKLVKKDNQDYEIKTKIPLFDGDYQFTKTTITHSNLQMLIEDIKKDDYIISEINETVINRYPPPPYTTSLLQQDAFHRFGFSSKQTMRLAQDLYERGYITYHRTDSFNLASHFVFKAKDYIATKYGQEYALDKPRGYKTKSKMAQEAHEAIRPTKLDREIITNEDKKLTKNHQKIYQLIFNRAISTQMKEAQIKQLKVFILGNKQYLFETYYQEILFPGFLKALNPDSLKKEKINQLNYQKGMKLDLKEVINEELTTKPPYRYNEASLIKSLEEKGIGRPSTYAPIISLLQEKNYVEKEFRYFKPTKLGEVISNYLSKSLPNLFTIDFTAKMENDLDAVASGKKNFITLLSRFFIPFKEELKQMQDDKQKFDVEEKVEKKCPQCGSEMVIRYSRFGKFYACSQYPKCKTTKPFLKSIPNKACPLCEGEIVVRYSKTHKRFYGCINYPKCKFSTWNLASIKSKE